MHRAIFTGIGANLFVPDFQSCKYYWSMMYAVYSVVSIIIAIICVYTQGDPMIWIDLKSKFELQYLYWLWFKCPLSCLKCVCRCSQEKPESKLCLHSSTTSANLSNTGSSNSDPASVPLFASLWFVHGDYDSALVNHSQSKGFTFRYLKGCSHLENHHIGTVCMLIREHHNQSFRVRDI